MSDNQDELAESIEAQHDGRAIFAQTFPANDRFNGEPVWEGVVHVFDLEGHPEATRAFAWSSPIEDSEKRRFSAVLQLGAIQSPLGALRAAIVAEHKGFSR